MKKIAKKFPKFLHYFSLAGIGIGFLGMALISFEVVRNLINLLSVPGVTAGVALVLPIEAKGVLYVPIAYWLLSIAIVVLVHEGGHGVIALLHKMPIKKTGLAVLGIIIPLIPAAFVEINEKVLQKRPVKQQLAVFAAGPLFNIALALLLIPGFFLITPIVDDLYTYNGVTITEVSDGFPIANTNLLEQTVHQVDDTLLTSGKDFSAALQLHQPGEYVNLHTSEGITAVQLGTNPNDNTKAYLGVFIEDDRFITTPTWFNQSIVWLQGLYMWVIILNLGVGLFNLIPIGPIDGGRMLHVALLHMTHEKHALRVWKTVSFFLLFVVVSGIAANFFI